MKRSEWILFIVFGVLLSICMGRGDFSNVLAETGEVYHTARSAVTQVAHKVFTEQTTDYELVAGVSDRQIVVDAVIVSANTGPTTVFFNDAGDGTTGYGPYRCPAGGTVMDRGIALKLDSGSSLYVSSGQASSDVCVEYHYK